MKDLIAFFVAGYDRIHFPHDQTIRRTDDGILLMDHRRNAQRTGSEHDRGADIAAKTDHDIRLKLFYDLFRLSFGNQHLHKRFSLVPQRTAETARMQSGKSVAVRRDLFCFHAVIIADE